MTGHRLKATSHTLQVTHTHTLKLLSAIAMYDVDDKVTQGCVLSRPWIKFQLRNLGFDHVAAGVPNGSWEHLNHRRLLH